MATVFKIGARGSALSLAQTRVAVRSLRQMFPDTRWRIVPMASPGDRDQTTPLEKSAPDFFASTISPMMALYAAATDAESGPES